MSAHVTLDRPYPRLLEWLAGNHVEYEIHEHDEAFTARASADAEHVDPRTFAKVVAIATPEGRRALVLVEATDQLDLNKARRAFDAKDVRLLAEPEMEALAPDCAVGALPAVGELFGIATYADFDVRDDPEISFNAGSHRFSVRVDRAKWERACGVVYADLALEDDSRPAWARS